MPAHACVFLYGGALDGLQRPEGTFYDYRLQGEDWRNGTSGDTPWTCFGQAQSPIDLSINAALSGAHTEASHRGDPTHRTIFDYPVIHSNTSNIMVINTGHNIQVEWNVSTYNGHVMIPFRGFKNSTITDVVDYPEAPTPEHARGTPVQFHFHTSSEHSIDGSYGVLEMHIVHTVPQSEVPGCDPQCFAVVGVIFREVESEDNPVLNTIFDAASEREGEYSHLEYGESIDLGALVPEGGLAGYLQYRGSLTTPPCSEGLLWHVFPKHQTISRVQMDRFMRLVGHKECRLNEDLLDDMVPEEDSFQGMGHMRKAQGEAQASTSEEHPELEVRREATVHKLAPRLVEAKTVWLEGDDIKRKLQEEFPRNASDYVCEVVAFGRNARRVQPRNGRLVQWYSKSKINGIANHGIANQDHS